LRIHRFSGKKIFAMEYTQFDDNFISKLKQLNWRSQSNLNRRTSLNNEHHFQDHFWSFKTQMTSEQRPHVYNAHCFRVSRLVVVHKFYSQTYDHLRITTICLQWPLLNWFDGWSFCTDLTVFSKPIVITMPVHPVWFTGIGQNINNCFCT